MNKKTIQGIVHFLGLKPRWVTRRIRRKKAPVSKIQRDQARTLVHARLEHFNQFYNFSYNKVFIKSQRTRWGSCSSNRNLNFNYRIITLAPELADYLVVHELCHLQEMNHGKAFWDLVALQIPDYKVLRTQLRSID